VNARSRSEEEAMSEVAMLRIPPNSNEAESSVLGGLLLNNDAWDRVGDLLRDTDFYRYEHRLIYTAIGQLVNANKPADVVTVFEALRTAGKAEEAGGLAYLNALAQYVPSAANIRKYAEIVREQSILRSLIAASDEIATAAFAPQGRTPQAILDDAEQRIFAVREAGASHGDDWVGNEEGITRLLDHIQDEYNGTSKPDFIPFGLKELDERLDGGGRPGEVIVIGARPSMGKSSLGLTIATNTARVGEPTAYWTGEMPASQLHKRQMAMASHIHLSRLKRAERLRDLDWPLITAGVEKLRHLPFFVSDRPGLNINQLRAMARSLKRKHGLRVLVVDHLSLMEALDPKQSRNYQLEGITQGLKRLAKELGLVILLLVQLSRDVEKRTDQTPMLSDLRDSGAIEQDADIVLFIHRPIKASPTLGEEWNRYAKVNVAKLRDGEPGYIHLQYIGENTLFTDWPEDQQIPSSHVRVARGGGL
jgi:replicative DNA helicase